MTRGSAASAHLGGRQTAREGQGRIWLGFVDAAGIRRTVGQRHVLCCGTGRDVEVAEIDVADRSSH